MESCRWLYNEFMTEIGIKEEFYQYIHNTGLSAFVADKPQQFYNLTRTFTRNFMYHPHTFRVSFHLYESSYTMSLDEFCDACKIPRWGSVEVPQPAEYAFFLTSLCNGEDRRVTQARLSSIHFPSIRHFVLFNGKCVVGKQECSALCAPDPSLIHTAITGAQNYNLGAIVARRLQRNASGGDLYGGIYAHAWLHGSG